MIIDNKKEKKNTPDTTSRDVKPQKILQKFLKIFHLDYKNKVKDK